MKKLMATILIAATLIITAFNPSEVGAVEQYFSYCEEIGTLYGISPELLEGICYTESRFNPSVNNEYGAVGICQIVPRWHQDRIKKLGITDISDPYQNILCCADYLVELRERYGDDLNAVLNAYNTGSPNYNETAYTQSVLDKAYEYETINGKHNY